MLKGINGVHWLMYSRDPDADRAFLRDVLGFSGLDIGGGWMIFALPPAEIGVHPGDGTFVQREGPHAVIGCTMWLMCDDVRVVMESLQARGVTCSAIQKEEWGAFTMVRLPSGGEIGLYAPSHPRVV